MASPFGHAVVGVVAAAIVARSTETPMSSPVLWGAAIVAAGLPDLDLTLAWFGRSGPAYHRNASHSLIVLVAVTGLVWLVLRSLFPDTPQGLFWAASAALASHPLLDVMTTGPALARRGYGIALFWPISGRRFSVKRTLVDSPEFDDCANLGDVLTRMKPELLTLGPLAGAALLGTLFL